MEVNSFSTGWLANLVSTGSYKGLHCCRTLLAKLLVNVRITMIFKVGIFLHIFFICAAITDYCYASHNPELHILQGEQVIGSFCPGSIARLKCVFPKNMVASAWYVNGSERPIEVRFLSEDYKGHSVDFSIEGGYTLLLTSLRRNPTEPVTSVLCFIFQTISEAI